MNKNLLYKQLKKEENRPYVNEGILCGAYLEKRIAKVLENPELKEEQKQILKEYLKSQEITGSKKKKTLLSQLTALSNFGEFVKKPYNEVIKKDVEEFILVLKNGNQQKIDELRARIKNGEKINKNTLRKYMPKAESRIHLELLYLKMFYKWLYQTEEYPDLVKWIKTKMPKNKITEDELLTPEERIKLIKCCSIKRDKAFIALISDSGGRIDEVLSANIKDIVPDEFGARFFIKQSKTKPRPIRLIMSVNYVMDWINEHPYLDDPQAPLFINLHSAFGRRLKYYGAREILLRAKRRAGITKKVNPHHFRHSRMGDLDKEGFTERDLRIFAGWSETSPMPSRYLHSGDKEVDKKLREKAGLIKEEAKPTNFNPKKCPRCKQLNPATAVYCNCGMALDLKAVIKDVERREQADQKLNDFFSDPEFKEMFKKFLEKKMAK